MTLIVLHIPKTAGTTFRQILSRQYVANDIYPLYEGSKSHYQVADFLNLSEIQRRNIKVLVGHMTFGFHKYFSQETSYVTFLREPIQRVISLYFHYMTHYTSKDSRVSLLEFLTKKMEFNQTFNHQTKIISGSKIDEKFPEKTLDLAKNNIFNHFCGLGLTERFDESLILLRRKLGWKTPLYVKDNISVNKPTENNFSRDTIELIKKYNELDIELYRYANKLLDDKISEQDDNFYEELKEFRIINPLASDFLKPTIIWK